MRVIGIGPGEPPPLDQDAEIEAFMAERGWTYAAEWLHEVDDEEAGEQIPGCWSRLIYREIFGNDILVRVGLMVSEAMLERPHSWPVWVDLCEHDLERRCAENGVDYERSTA